MILSLETFIIQPYIQMVLRALNYTGCKALLIITNIPEIKTGFGELLPHALNRLDHAYEIYGTNPPLVFFGWDERLGAGFEAPGILENQYAYSFLAIEVWKAFAVVLEDLGEKMAAEQYRGYAAQK